jgi:hypothetical protein
MGDAHLLDFTRFHAETGSHRRAVTAACVRATGRCATGENAGLKEPSLVNATAALRSAALVALALLATRCSESDSATNPNARDVPADETAADVAPLDQTPPDAAPDAAPPDALPMDAAMDAAPDVSPDVEPDAAPDVAPDAAPDVAPDVPPAPQMHCGDITTDTRWASDRVHVVTCDIHVQGPAAPTLTIEAGARVEFRRDVGLFIAEDDRGRLVVDGASAPVVFTSNEAMKAPGDWTGVTIGYNDQRSTLTGLTLEYAGGNMRGGLYLSQSSPTITRSTLRFHANHGVYVDTGAAPTVTESTLSDNLADGLFVAPRGTLGGPFLRNTVARNGRYPASLPASQAHQLDATSAFTGNRTERVALTGDTLARSVAWQRLDVDYLVSGTVTVSAIAGATLTIRDGVRAFFASGAGLTAGGTNPGALIVEGTTRGVVFTSAATTPAAGDWSGVSLAASDVPSTLTGLSVLFAGANPSGALQIAAPGATVRRGVVRSSARHGIYVHTGGVATIAETTAADNALDGVYVSTAGALSLNDAPGFDRNVLTGNRQHPVTVPANFVGELAATTTYGPNTIDRVRVTNDYVERSATWRRLGAPYLLAETFNIQGAAAPRVTVEDGALFYAASGVRAWVGEGMPGTLVAQGATMGVRFTSAAERPAAGDWIGLYFGTNARGSRLVRTTVEHAGTAAERGAVVVYFGDVELEDCTLQDSAGYGLYLWTNGSANVVGTTIRRSALGGIYSNDTSALGRGMGGSFVRNTLTANGGPPLNLTATHLRELDATSTFTGNAEDAVIVRGATLSRDATWRRLDVPYRFNHHVVVQNTTGTAVITIEAGARFRFDRTAGLNIADNAGLRVQGTATDPVVFTSSAMTPAAGDWLGLKLGNSCLSSQVDIAGLTLSYGGAQTYGPGTAGAIWWIDCNGTLRDSTITDSTTWGLFRIRATPTVSNVTYRNNALGNAN